MNKKAVENHLCIEGKVANFDKTTRKVEIAGIEQSALQKNRENDNISHFLCRLAYCRNEDLRKWFITQEGRFFQLRLKALTYRNGGKNTARAFLERECSVRYENLHNEHPDWKKFQTQITFSAAAKVQSGNTADESFKADSYLKIPFKEAIQLVGRRAVFMHRGFAYVHIDELTSIATAHFRTK